MTRIFAVLVGLLAAAAAFYWLGSDRPLTDVAAGPPHDPIDSASRAKLDRVLRDGERQAR